MVDEKKYYYSEIFHSIQGEGEYTGTPTAWIRFFLCNLQCNGFGQKDPTDPSTYELPFQDFDVDSVKRVEDLPVSTKRCCSAVGSNCWRVLKGFPGPRHRHGRAGSSANNDPLLQSDNRSRSQRVGGARRLTEPV